MVDNLHDSKYCKQHRFEKLRFQMFSVRIRKRKAGDFKFLWFE